MYNSKGNADEESIKRFIEQMNSCVENLSAVFTEILEFFINQRPRLTNETITVLFQGYKQNFGLLQTLSIIDNEKHIVCSNGFKLLNLLLDYEHNRDAETFIRTFCSLSNKSIQTLKLSKHISEANTSPCKQYVFRVLEIYLSRNNIQKEDIIVKILQDKRSAYEEFKRWQYQQKILNLRITGKYSQQNSLKSNYNQDDDLIQTRKWQLIHQETQKPFTKFKQSKGDYIKITTHIDAKDIDSLIEQLTVRQMQWNCELIDYNYLDGVMVESYKMTNKDQINTLKYIFQVNIDKQDDSALIEKNKLTENEGYLKSNDIVGEAKIIIQIELSKKCNFKVRFIMKHLNHASKKYYYPQMTGEVITFVQNLQNLSSMN